MIIYLFIYLFIFLFIIIPKKKNINYYYYCCYNLINFCFINKYKKINVKNK